MKRNEAYFMEYTPCIIIPGIGQSKMELLDENNQKIKMAWQLDVDSDALIKKLKFPMLRSVIFRCDSGLSKKMAEAVSDIVSPIAHNPDGTMKNNVRVVDYPQSLAECTEDERDYIYRMVPVQHLSHIITENNMYFFAFNSFGMPYEIAADLNDYIQKVKAKHNCDKVNLIPISLGGAMSIAYFDAYGYKDIKRVMYFVPALQGTPIISSLVDMDIDIDNALSLVRFMFPRSTADMLEKVLGLLPKKVGEKLIMSAFGALNEDVVLPCGAMWATVPPEKYSPLAGKHLRDEKYAALKEQTDRFYKAQAAFPEDVKKMKADGVEFFAVVGYGLQLMPIVRTDLNSDGVINTSSASLGAELAPLGETLEGKEKSDYISPDGIIDASKSILPDTVWYFKDQFHDGIAYNDTALNVAAKVLSDDSFNSVYSSPDYPRFGVKQDNRK